VGGKDGTVPPVQAKQALALLHNGELTEWLPYGHLVHEEAPAETLLYCLKQLHLE
jgi:pimeloyl-ACP methyl ester carboxylesterase